MDVNKNCTVCNMKSNVVIYLKHRTVCKTCHKRNRRKNNNNISHHNQKSKLLITIKITIEPLTSSDEVLQLLELIQSRIPRSTRI